MSATPFSLAGRVALVTGANAGIGQGMAVALAAAGADIAAVGRSSPAETGEQVRASGRRFLAIEAELGTAAPCQQIIDQVIAQFGAVDILVNNAGIIRRSDALEFSEADWDAVLMWNLKTVFFPAQAVARVMVPRGHVARSSIWPPCCHFRGGVRVASYTASKSGASGASRGSWRTNGPRKASM